MMLAPVRTSAPATTPVSLTEAKAHCRVDDSNSDTVLTALIAAATDHMDGWSGVLGRALVTQTWQQDFDGFAADGLRLPLGPAASVSSVTYYDADNAQQTLSADVYRLFTDAIGPYVGLKPDQDWPNAYSRPDAVRVTYVAGAAASDVPAAIKTAMLLLIGHWFENREAVAVGTATVLPLSVDVLLAPYRRVGM